ncbi:hypothetical protein NKJ38_32215 [Mesorhizobium sp. M0205]
MKAVLDLELGLIVRETVERLQNQDLEHHTASKGPAAFGAIGALQRLGQRFQAPPRSASPVDRWPSLNRT